MLGGERPLFDGYKRICVVRVSIHAPRSMPAAIGVLALDC